MIRTMLFSFPSILYALDRFRQVIIQNYFNCRLLGKYWNAAEWLAKHKGKLFLISYWIMTSHHRLVIVPAIHFDFNEVTPAERLTPRSNGHRRPSAPTKWSLEKRVRFVKSTWSRWLRALAARHPESNVLLRTISRACDLSATAVLSITNNDSVIVQHSAPLRL